MNRRPTNRNQYKAGPNRNVGNQNSNSNQAQTPLSQQNRSHQPNFHTPTPPSPVNCGPCVECNSITVLVCQRCGDYFCSPACQQKNWPKHRYICFQMPSLVHSSEVLTANMPALNGYQNRELPLTVQAGNPLTPNSPHRKWVNNSPSTPLSPQNQQQQPQQKQQQFQQQQQVQTKSNNRQTPPKSSSIEPEKSLVNIGMVEQVPFPKTNSAVLVTAFRSSNRVFIRSIEKEDNEGYCAVLKTINDYGKTAGPLKIMPTRNAFAITDFNHDGLYYRVQVVSAKNENDIHVIYYDFGNEAKKKLSDLKEISMKCSVLKQYIVLATLKHVPFFRDGGDNNKLKEYLKSFEDAEGKIMYKENEKPECEITIYGAEDTLNKKICLFLQNLKTLPSASGSAPERRQQQEQPQNQKPQAPKKEPPKEKSPQPQLASDSSKHINSQTQRKRPSQLAKPVMSPPFELVTLPAHGKNLNVIIVDNSLMLFGYFACVLAEDKNNLQAIQAYLSEYEDNGRPYKPKVEEYILAKFEGSWYRAKALSFLSAEFVEVVFIDFLNESQVAVSHIRRYPMDLDLPCKTSLCMIDELPTELNDEIVEYLKDKLQPGSEHKINEVKGMEEDESNVVIVKMNQLEKWLAAISS